MRGREYFSLPLSRGRLELVRTVRFVVRGRVQGVGFRYFTLRAAEAAGVAGWVRNLPDGSVEAVAAGEPDALERFRAALREGPPASAVGEIEEHERDEAPRFARFEIR